MSAIVYPICGHARHMMEVDWIQGSPQLHLHFLTEQEEHAEFGYLKVELCCHGCGSATLIYYHEIEGEAPQHVAVKSTFEKMHKNCPNRGYEELCPNYRSSIQVIDMRQVRRRKKTNGSLTHPDRTGPIPPPGQGVDGDGRPPNRKKEIAS